MRARVLILALFCLAGTLHCQSLAQIMTDKATKVLKLSAQQQRNALAIMNQCVAFTSDQKQLAYVLSTAFGECGISPIKEYRAKEGTALWNTQNKYWYTGYYGRGYVQLTHKENYEKFGKLLGVDLVNNPDSALDPTIAGKIICIGMVKGLFTGVGLSKYLGPSLNDWTNARRIINGVDKAQAFGDRGKAIFSA